MANDTSAKCDCASRFQVVIGDDASYDRAKKLLNAGRHPTFIGRDTVCRNARNGGLLIFRWQDSDVVMMQMPIRAVKFFRRSANSLNDKAI